MRNFKNLTIKNKLIISISVTFILIFFVSFFSSYCIVSNSIIKIKTREMRKLVTDSAKIIEAEIDKKMVYVNTIARDSYISSDKNSIDEKVEKLNLYSTSLGIRNIGIIDKNYIIHTNTKQIELIDRNKLSNVMENGSSYIEGPVEGEDSVSVINIYVPIYSGAAIKGILICSFESNFILNHIESVKQSAYDTSFITNSKGCIISHQKDAVMKEYDIKEGAQHPVKSIIYGKTYCGRYRLKDKDIYISYAPVKNLDNFSFVLETDAKYVEQDINLIRVIFCITALLGSIITFVILNLIGDRIFIRLAKLEKHIKAIAGGILTDKIDNSEIQKLDEIGSIYRSIDKTRNSIRNIIIDIKGKMDNLSEYSDMLNKSSAENQTKLRII